MTKHLILGSLGSVWELDAKADESTILENLEEGLQESKTVPVYAVIDGKYATLHVNPAAAQCWAIVES